MNTATATQSSMNTKATGSCISSDGGTLSLLPMYTDRYSIFGYIPCIRREKREGYDGSSPRRRPLGISTRRYSSPHEPCLGSEYFGSGRSIGYAHLSERTDPLDHPSLHTTPPLYPTATIQEGLPHISSLHLFLTRRSWCIGQHQVGITCRACRCT